MRVHLLAPERDAWKALAEARGELLACYHLGKTAPVLLLNRIDKARGELRRLGAIQ